MFSNYSLHIHHDNSMTVVYNICSILIYYSSIASLSFFLLVRLKVLVNKQQPKTEGTNGAC